MAMTPKIKKEIFDFLQQHRSPDLLTAYFFYLEKQFKIEPVAFVQDKVIYQSSADAMKKLEESGKVWRETEIKIGYGPPTVDEKTKRIYICPFTGKVFADNTHPNPQDAIYDWVTKCPENTERVDGVKAKRFHVSDDKEVINNYIKPRKEPITKIVYSSAVSGKLYNSKEAVIKDFKQNYLKSMTLVDVQNQNRFELEEDFLHFIEEHLQESKITQFVEALADDELFAPYVNAWVEA
ncbi:MAG: hypothetical protein S4CHLAM81_13910 [Chlamydiales bacterium]|nr:hypothetical protein [Chlamydiales bacterium]MCH9636163.1 hypothetical protein [Chlamydiales bacterium]MCH9703815.1 DUF2709 domain-containing protein [Chlamydiota bacterium]